MENPYLMREACRKCGAKHGYIETKTGQDIVYCLQCDAYVYCAPKTETGRPQRTVRTRPDIPPKQRVRILLRDGATCAICHADNKNLHVGHLLSVEDGHALGATDDELYDDENLAAMCDECNLGLGATTITTRLYLRVLRARRRQQERE